MEFLKNVDVKKIKLLAFDLDGTLLNNKSRVSQRTRETLKKAKDAGLILAVATGRVYTSFPSDIAEIPAIEYAISSNGAHIINQKNKEMVYENLLDPKAVRRIYPLLFDKRAMLEIFFDHKAHTSEFCYNHLEDFGIVTELRKNYVRATRKPVEDLKSLLEENIDRLENLTLGFADLSEKYAMNEALQQYKDLTVVCTQHFSIEIGGKTTSKAEALVQLCHILGFEKENCMVFGDSNNDAAMLKCGGTSVAMGNAPKEIKEISDIIAPTNEEDGVAAVIEELLKNM